MKKITLFFLLLLSQVLTAQDVKVLDLETNDVLYLSSTDRLYITTSEGVEYGNSLCIVDPYHGTIDTCFTIGHSPGVMAYSDDERYIYIGLQTSSEIVRFDVQNATIGLRIPLKTGNESQRKFYAEDIAVLPGSPHVIAVALMEPDSLPHQAGIVVYENEVMRPMSLPATSGSNSITFDTQTGILYGYRNETNTDLLIRKMRVDESGVVVEKALSGLLDRVNDQIKYAAGKIYSHFGKVISLSNDTLVLEGNFNVGFAFPVVEPVVDSGKIFFLNTADAAISFQIFDRSSFSLIEELKFPNIKGNPYKLIHWSRKGTAAFITRDFYSGYHSRLVIMRNCTSEITEAPEVDFDGIACMGDTVSLYAHGPDGSVFWSNGQLGPEARLIYNEAVFCSVADENGCLSPHSDTVLVSFYQYPAEPYIYLSDDSLYLYSSSDYGYGMQWFLNGEPIPGAETSRLDFTEPGTYTFQVNWGGCLSSLSNELSVVLTNLNDPVEQIDFKLFPNPVNDIAYLQVLTKELERGTMHISSFDGKLLRTQVLLPHRGVQEVSMDGLPSGIYILQIFNETGRRIASTRLAKL